jgi:bifunctional UDP-N-acetylglucosamine pyrophosphorylase / glucosamine-1-phosphate N-acetyltransferase
MTARTLVVPAAGLGSRLGAALPKLLVRVAGIPMIDRLLDAYRGVVSEAVIVVHPSFEPDVRRHLAGSTLPVRVAVQTSPTGMLDAILLARNGLDPAVRGPVWITWCDQVGVSAATIRNLEQHTTQQREAAVVMPTVWRDSPYIHLQRDETDRIVRILQRREGDSMPERGESDMGLFALSAEAYWELLTEYARLSEIGQATSERNFLPFIPWVARRRSVATFPATDPMEAVGVNTPEELRAVEAYLRAREASAS